MRIASLSTFYPYRGGIAHYNSSLYRELEKSHEIKAFTFTRQYPDLLFPGSSQYVTDEDKVDAVPAVRTLDTINPITYFTTANKIKQYAPDLMLMKFWMPFFAPSLGTVAKLVKKKTKVISVLDNVIPHEKRIGDTALIKYFLNQNHGFVVMSETVKEDLLSFNPEAKYIFHEHPLYDHFGASVDTSDAKKKLGIPENKKVLLFFGFIRDYKGLDILLDAITKLDDSYVLVIAGETYGSFDSYDKQITELNLQNKIVKHVRYISDDEVPLFFSSADVCVLPYKSATQSGIASISFHFELPMIVTDVGGLKEMVTGRGLVVEFPDAALIANAIKSYFADNLRNSFTENIRDLKEKLSWKHLSDSIIEFYKTL